MNIFDFREKLIESYQSFSRSFTKIRAEDIQKRVDEECFNNKRFWPDPLIQINPCYKVSKTVQDLASSGVLHPLCGDIFRNPEKLGEPMWLYEHQLQAIDNAAKNRSFVVTTGTGSGKSLCFFIPIVSRILREKETDKTRRTRAIILYPMNALANSQLEEIEKYLKNVDSGITVGRYTGQEKGPQREYLQDNPPDILLTNYMMLELVLMRPNDRPLIENCWGLEFLVLDELHTYRGRQGADVAMLVRRLRSQLHADNLICIGTSATMASGGTRQDQQEVVARFASRMFATKIERANVISETLSRQTDLRAANPQFLHGAVEDAAEGRTGLTNYESFRTNQLAIWVERNLSINNDNMRAEPKSLSDIATLLAKDARVNEDVARKALTHFLSAFGGEDGVKTPGGKNPFPFKLHQFLSGPGKMYTTLEAPNYRELTLDGQAFVIKDGVRVPLFEVYFCKECGEEYIPVWASIDADGGIQSVSPRSMDDMSSDDEVQFGYLCPVKRDQAYTGNPEDLPDEWLDFSRVTPRVKQSYRAFVPQHVILDTHGNVVDRGTEFWFLPKKFRLCINCYSTFVTYGKDKNRLIGLSGEGRSSATSVITLQVLRLLYACGSVDPDHDFRKLLGFVDNRQDAALQAGHFNDFINQLILRGGLVAVLSDKTEPMNLTEIVRALMKNFHFDRGADEEGGMDFLRTNVIVHGDTLRSAHDAVRFAISYRLLRDLEDRNLYTSPSLEKLNLLKVSYRHLDELCADNAAFQQCPALFALKASSRKIFLMTMLDEFRRRQCISSRFFESEEQRAVRDAGFRYLSARWNLFAQGDRNLSTGHAFTFDAGFRSSKNFNGMYLTSRSRLVKRLGSLEFWKDEAKPSDMNPKDRSQMLDVVRQAVDILVRMGIVCGTTRKFGTEYRIADEAILWSCPKESGRSVNAFYHTLYKNVAELLKNIKPDLFEFESEEHTAQVSSDDRELFEMRFRASKDDRKAWKDANLGKFRRLPVLYCSPTMELGIDISALNYVYMRNVPPTAANYVQRAGRAGRSGQQALSLTYCTAQSPHDQWFFQHPKDMVQGIVKEPTLDLTNEALLRSHLHSVWMSAACFSLGEHVSKALDIGKPGHPLLEEIRQIIESPEVTNRAIAMGLELLKQVRSEVLGCIRHPEAFVETTMKNAATDFDRAFDAWRSLYDTTIDQLRRSNEILMGRADQDEQKVAQRRYNDALNQKKLLDGTIGSKSQNNDFYTYRYLANQGFLPGYNFPSMPMTAWIPAPGGLDDEATILSRARFLGISEFGPGNLIYHRGRIYRIRRVKISTGQNGGTAGAQLATITAAVCPNCGYAHVFDGKSVVNQCQNCGQELKQENVLDGLYQISMVETEETERISVEDENRQNQGFEMQTLYRFAELPGGAVVRSMTAVKRGEETLAHLTYAPSATLWRVNLGWKSRKNQKTKGFVIDPLTGYWDNSSPDSLDEPKDAEERFESKQSLKQQVIPYVKDVRNLLILHPEIESDEDMTVVMSTLQAAFKRAIEQHYQIEASEIFVEPLPSREDRRSLLIYESGEGGSGILHDLGTNKEALKAVADLALRIMHYVKPEGVEWCYEDVDQYDRKADCVSGCYECLLTYFNQPEHQLIDRRNPTVVKFLMALASSDGLASNETEPEEDDLPEGTLWDRFEALLHSRGLAMPDKMPKTFKALDLTFDGAYSNCRTVVSTMPVEDEDKENLEEFGWTVIDISDESAWSRIIEEHPEVFSN